MATSPLDSTPDPTQAALNKISAAKAQGSPMTIDFGNMPDNVDSRQVVGALLDGLPPDKANQLNAVALGGHKATINFGKIPGLTPNSNPGGIYEDYPIRRDISKYLIRPGLEIAGQTLGGMGGAALGTAEAPGVGTAAMGLAGATAGGTAADELANKIDEEMGLYHPESYPPNPTAKRLGEEAVGNAVMAGTGALVGKAVGGVAAPFSEKLNEPVREVAQELNVPLTAAQQSKSRLLQQMEQMVSKLPISADIIGKFYDSTKTRMTQIADSLLGQQMTPEVADRIGTNVAQQVRQKVTDLAQSGTTPQLDLASTGDAVAQDLSDYTKSQMQKSSQAFQALKGSVPHETVVPLTQTAQQAQKLLDQHSALPPALQNKQLLGVLNDLIPKTDVGDLGNLAANASPDALAKMQAAGIVPEVQTPGKSIQDVMGLRSALGDAAVQHEGAFQTNQPGTKFMGSPVSGAYKSLVGALDKDLDTFSQQTGGDFAKNYAAARAQHAAGIQLMENPYFKRILSTDSPENIVDLAVRPGDTTNLRALLGTLQPETRDQMQNAFVNSMVEKATDQDGQFVPNKLAVLLKRYGDDTVNLAAGDQGSHWLGKMANFNDGTWSDPGFRNFLAQIGRKDGENVSSFLLQPNNAMNINRTRALIGEQPFSEAQDGMIYHLLTNNQGNVDFGGLSKRLNEAGPETLNAALGPEKVGTLQKLAVLGNATKSPGAAGFANPSGTAPMMGTFFILRSLFNAPMKALEILTNLGVGADLYTKPFVTKLLTEGMPGADLASHMASGAVRVPISVAANRLENPYRKR